MKKVIVSGLGKMGAQLIKTIEQQEGIKVVAIIEPIQDIPFYKTNLEQYPVFQKAENAFKTHQADVVVDFTNSTFTAMLAPLVFKAKMRFVVGTSNLSKKTIALIQAGSKKHQLGCVIAPNFALGAVLMMHFSEKAAAFYEVAEIIEKHHDEKIDSPSGTAMETAERMIQSNSKPFKSNVSKHEKVANARGGEVNGIRLHSIRLPGVIAGQQVILSGEEEELTISHNSIGRKSFMPGIILAIKYVFSHDDYVFGLDKILKID